jgi:hypothetical protein
MKTNPNSRPRLDARRVRVDGIPACNQDQSRRSGCIAERRDYAPSSGPGDEQTRLHLASPIRARYVIGRNVGARSASTLGNAIVVGRLSLWANRSRVIRNSIHKGIFHARQTSRGSVRRSACGTQCLERVR